MSDKQFAPGAKERQTADAVSGFLTMVARYRRSAVREEGYRRSIRFDEFRQIVRRYRPSDLLPALAALAASGGEEEFLAPPVTGIAPPWAIALASRESILWGNEHRREGITADNLRVLFNAHSNIYETKNGSAPEGMLPMLTRITYEQFPYQESLYEEVSRTHALLVEGIDHIEPEILTPAALDALVGAPLGQVVGATFFLQVAALKNHGWFDRRWLDRDDLNDVYPLWPRDVIEQRAADLSCTFEEFKAAYDAVPHPPEGYERYAFNPLTARPFVVMPDGRLLAPQPRLILPTVSPGALYYRGIGSHGEAFARDLGKLAEHYVGRQLATVDGASELHPEVKYGKPEQKSIDWFLTLPSCLVMCEVKSARFGLLEKAATKGFEQRVQVLLDKAITQLMRTSEELDAGTEAFAHLPADLPRIGFIVTSEPFYLANSPWMRELVRKAPFPVLVASLREIESLVTLPAEEIQQRVAGHQP